MFQTICKLMLIVPLLFAGALLTVHGQRAHDDVRQFLAPTPACAMPCWQGIQPGVTTIDQANALLSANPWIDTVQVVDQPPATYLYWKWSARKPEFAGDPHLLIPPLMWGEGGVIQLIFIPTGLAYGEVSLLLGAPLHGSFQVSRYANSVAFAALPNTRHVATYFGGQVNFDIQVSCPINLDRFWNAPVTITYVSTDLTNTMTSKLNYTLADWLYRQPCNL